MPITNPQRRSDDSIPVRLALVEALSNRQEETITSMAGDYKEIAKSYIVQERSQALTTQKLEDLSKLIAELIKDTKETRQSIEQDLEALKDDTAKKLKELDKLITANTVKDKSTAIKVGIMWTGVVAGFTAAVAELVRFIIAR